MRYAFFMLTGLLLLAPAGADAKLKVVTTSADYHWVVEELGGDRVVVTHLVQGDQDPHFMRPKPSLSQRLADADLLIATGLDLEMWLPTLIDKSGNPRVREGQVGYVAAADGIDRIEIPKSVDRAAGDVHVMGNPHVHTSPINMKVIAKNIAIGLVKVDPDHRAAYENRLKAFQRRMDERLFGKELVKMIGGQRLCTLASKGKLVPFLQKRKYKGKPMVELLGGWLKKAMPLRGVKLVSFHKNWGYFEAIFGVNFVAEIEAKPGIPPSPGDVKRIIERMSSLDVKVIFAANYFDASKIHRISQAVGATEVIVPLSVGGAEGVNSYWKLVDFWLDRLLATVGS